MLMPTARVSVANTTFTRPVDEALLDDLLHRRHHAGMMRGHTDVELGDELRVAEHARGRPSSRLPSRASMMRRIASRSSAVVSRRPASTHAFAAASHWARLKMKKMAGSIDRWSRSSTVSTRPGGPTWRRPAPGPAVATVRRRRPGRCRVVELQGVAVGAAVDEHRAAVCSRSRVLVRHEVLVLQLDRALALDDRRGRSAHGGDPLGQFGDVAHRRRQAHEADVLRQVDDHLLPHRAPVGVLEEVHLVEHDQSEVVAAPATARRSCCAAPRSSSRRSGRRR